jgi:hypothetical protein
VGETGAEQPLFPEDAAVDPLADPFASAAGGYAQPESPEPRPPMAEEGEPDVTDTPAYMAPGLAAGGLAAGAFATPPALPAEEGPAGATFSESPYADEDRPAEPFIAGGAPVVAPPEPGHAPGAYAGVAPEPAFPTHAAPAEAAAGHALGGDADDAPPAADADADAGFRQHYAEHYGAGGGSYDDLADAYRFGAESAAIPELRWAGDETLRRRFNERFGYPENDRMAWLGAREAVKRGMLR